ncbi:MAG: flagellar biosynthetic protein FliO [Gammaproteobacteria bacterium]|nr:flagellar biosynthetic protein FliO [Gammaproteobacteria bacterium]
MVALSWLTKKINRFRFITDDSLKIIGGLSMGSRERVVLMQVGDNQLLIGVTPGRINTLHVLDTPIETTDIKTNESPGQSFSNKLKAMMVDANKGKGSND